MESGLIRELQIGSIANAKPERLRRPGSATSSWSLLLQELLP